jgi:hypothetical protein
MVRGFTQRILKLRLPLNSKQSRLRPSSSHALHIKRHVSHDFAALPSWVHRQEVEAMKSATARSSSTASCG